VEDPQTFAGLGVETADVTLFVGLASRISAGQMRGADDDYVVDDERGGVEADFAGDEVHVLVVFGFQIDNAVLAEAPHRLARLSIERDQLITGRDVEDPLLASVGPIRQPAA
jgi:hypothetical protein